jgi:hypothetical protein
MALVLLANANTPVLEKATRNFSRDYKGASAVNWALTKEGGYVCRFTLEGVGQMAFYDRKGNWESTVAGYTETQMSKDLRKTVLSNYYDYSIIYVHEIRMAGKPTVYMVQVKDKRFIKILRVTDGELEEVRELEASV